ncbi:hypothetical protein [Streptomyces sp. NBC_00576]|uniref:hypothetical protein n=1 Tax=Streptomyces sp. NBC_00576 TaxID=2903665 RepID=UPI002E807E20|nr:hypothetical protein [Streptomyces sp. NBC_00576]WUB70852.1 hypothetical protein OG734_12580 [Streptomyces sp. NBC_00576]
MSRATGVSGAWSGAAALLLAFGATNASAAPHTPRVDRVERVSTAADGSQSDGESMSAAISADGHRVAFTSTAPSFGCAHFTPCLLVKDLPTGEVTRIDVGSGNTYGYPLPSTDGSRIAFSAGTRFMAPYLYDRATGRSERLWPENPPGFNELGRVQSISPDGTHVAYTIGNRNGPENYRLLYVRDTATGSDELISPAEEGDKVAPSISADGREVAFQQGRNIHVRDLDTGATTRVRGTEPSLSGTGTHLAYTSAGTVYLLELATGERQLISVDRWGGRNDLPARNPSANSDGTVVAFESASSDLVKGDTNGVTDVFLRTVQ